MREEREALFQQLRESIKSLDMDKTLFLTKMVDINKLVKEA